MHWCTARKGRKRCTVWSVQAEIQISKTRSGILFTGFWHTRSMHSTGTWTQTSFDTSHVQGPGLNSKQWSHLHCQHIQNWQGITMDLVLELMFTWEIILIRTSLCQLFKLTSTTMIIKLMIGSFVTLLSQELEWLWLFGLVTFYYLIHRNRSLFLLTVELERRYFAFLLTLKRRLLVSMIIVTHCVTLQPPQNFDSVVRILDISIIIKNFSFCIFIPVTYEEIRSTFQQLFFQMFLDDAQKDQHGWQYTPTQQYNNTSTRGH